MIRKDNLYCSSMIIYNKKLNILLPIKNFISAGCIPVTSLSVDLWAMKARIVNC